ncbi:MAG: hypothetical protein H6Q52_2147 [Deltaproteobacteria bacterium]|nr:hypothetical protein [Deltaproteobacteria bacterium]
MRVFVNNSEIHLAPGMTVRHAVMGAGLLEEINAGKKVFDERGNEVGLDGELSENDRIYVEGQEETGKV